MRSAQMAFHLIPGNRRSAFRAADRLFAVEFPETFRDGSPGYAELRQPMTDGEFISHLFHGAESIEPAAHLSGRSSL